MFILFVCHGWKRERDLKVQRHCRKCAQKIKVNFQALSLRSASRAAFRVRSANALLPTVAAALSTAARAPAFNARFLQIFVVGMALGQGGDGVAPVALHHVVGRELAQRSHRRFDRARRPGPSLI